MNASGEQDALLGTPVIRILSDPAELAGLSSIMSMGSPKHNLYHTNDRPSLGGNRTRKLPKDRPLT